MAYSVMRVNDTQKLIDMKRETTMVSCFIARVKRRAITSVCQ